MENVVNEKHLWLSHIWTGCSQGTRLLIHSHNLQLRGKWWWTYWGGAPLRIMTFESCHLKFETWLGICGSLETPEPIWIWNLVSQIRQLIIIVRLKWQCWAIPQFQKHPQYHSFVVPPNSVAVGCQEDKVKGTAGPLFTTFHDHLTSCGPNDFDEFRKIYWFYWLRIHTPSIKAWDWDFVQIFPAQWPVSRRLPPNSSFLRGSKLQCGPPR